MTPERIGRKSAWISMTEEMREDSKSLNALIEYEIMGRRRRVLTHRERIAGRYVWTASNGVAIVFRTAWRRRLDGVASIVQHWRNFLRS